MGVSVSLGWSFCFGFRFRARGRYVIQDGNQDAKFALNSATGAITLVAALDYETMLPSAAFYTLTVKVSDNGVPTLPVLMGCVNVSS
jgi:hypothetical protein